MNTKNTFIVLEGVEGSGKSTQSQVLSQKLSSEGISNLLVREPGSTNTGEKIRALILEGCELNPLTELFLFSAARSELIQNEIIIVQSTEAGTGTGGPVPDWVKNVAGWWASDQIDDETFANSLTYLIEIGLIQVS